MPGRSRGDFVPVSLRLSAPTPRRAAALELAQYLTLDKPERLVILHCGEYGREMAGMWNPE